MTICTTVKFIRSCTKILVSRKILTLAVVSQSSNLYSLLFNILLMTRLIQFSIYFSLDDRKIFPETGSVKNVLSYEGTTKPVNHGF